MSSRSFVGKDFGQTNSWSCLSPGLSESLVDVTVASIISDEHMAEMLADQVQETLRHGGVSVDNFFCVGHHSPLGPFSTAYGSSVDNISLWKDSGFV